MGVARRTFITGAAGTAALLATGTAAGASPGEADAQESAYPGLNRDVEAVVAMGAVSALSEVRRNGCATRAAAGTVLYGGMEPAPAYGRFRAGSVIKPFVAVVVLQLADEGRLRLDDTVEKWVPGLVPNGAAITLEMLLRHTSGIADYVPVLMPGPAEFLANRFRTFTARELVGYGVSVPPEFPPGTEHSYSNTGYVLLGMVVERASGRTYAREIERRVLRPLGLADTVLPGTDPYLHGPHAHTYIPLEDGTPVDVTEMNPSLAGASGELVSTTWDLNRFFRALVLGGLVDTSAMFDDQGTGYGLGVELYPLPSGTAIGHGGGGPGFIGVAATSLDGARQATVFAARWGEDNPRDAMYALVSRGLADQAPYSGNRSRTTPSIPAERSTRATNASLPFV